MTKKITALFTSISFLLTANSSFAESSYEYLDKLSIAAGTDKSSLIHNYTKVYAQYFDPIKSDPIKFLEIGILNGESVKLWESYFSNAELHFIDINLSSAYQPVRSKYHLVDQTDVEGLTRFANSVGGNFDVIIDDGGHKMIEQITSFKTLFPFIKTGGLYIIEDLHTSYWKKWGGTGDIGNPIPSSGTCVDFLQHLVDDLNYTSGVTAWANFDLIPQNLKENLTYYQEHIDSIHFYKSLCIIIKK